MCSWTTSARCVALVYHSPNTMSATLPAVPGRMWQPIPRVPLCDSKPERHGCRAVRGRYWCRGMSRVSVAFAICKSLPQVPEMAWAASLVPQK